MPHDANGELLKVGDKVLIEGHITHLSDNDAYCNCSVELLYRMPPDMTVTTISSINAGQLVKDTDEPDDVDAAFGAEPPAVTEPRLSMERAAWLALLGFVVGVLLMLGIWEWTDHAERGDQAISKTPAAWSGERLERRMKYVAKAIAWAKESQLPALDVACQEWTCDVHTPSVRYVPDCFGKECSIDAMHVRYP